MAGEDHSTELSFLVGRYPQWTIWYGTATGSWWALPPRERDIGDFVEAADLPRLIAHIEEIQSELPAYRDPSSILRLGAPPVRRVPLATRPGDPAR
ncbi:hypothetical protein ABGB12_06740 [Actinocorallia sp. B10E7]|uniref:hypothetical protein n=1 Tax=Actinocorallia sp. B10E7 TaxID=3153558 RepID=UPI00325ED5A0